MEKTDREITVDDDLNFHLNLHDVDIEFIKVTIKKKNGDVLYEILGEEPLPYDNGALADCSEVLKECQQEYAKKEKGYEDKLQNCRQQIDACNDIMNKEINMLLNIIDGNNRSLEEKDNECKSSLEQKDNECKSSLEQLRIEYQSSLEQKEMEYQKEIRKIRDNYEHDKDRINKNLGNRIYDCNKDRTSCDEREKSCIRENFELKHEK